jgi:hypothetical protein
MFKCYFDYMIFESAKSKTIDICTKMFCGSMILFYVLWIMFHDESGSPPMSGSMSPPEFKQVGRFK